MGLRPHKLQKPAPGVGWGWRRHSLGHHRPLGTMEELVLGSLGHKEARDDRFSLSDIADCYMLQKS